MKKVPGEENCADRMTKHFGAKTINQNVDKMKMSFEAGRAAKAAALHAVSAAPEQNFKYLYSTATQSGVWLWEQAGV